MLAKHIESSTERNDSNNVLEHPVFTLSEKSDVDSKGPQ